MRLINLIILMFAYVINADAAGAVLNNNSSTANKSGTNLSSQPTAPSPAKVTATTSTTTSNLPPQVLEAYNPVEEPYRNRFRLGSLWL